jgi:hypothetical protein
LATVVRVASQFGEMTWFTVMYAGNARELALQYRADLRSQRFDAAFARMAPDFRARWTLPSFAPSIRELPLHRHDRCSWGALEYIGQGFIVRDRDHHDVYLEVAGVDGGLYVSAVGAEGRGL